MDLVSLFANVEDFAHEFASSYCLVNGRLQKLEDIQKMGYEEFSYRARLNMPLKLYRYYPNKTNGENGENYSIQALRDNTVYLQTPIEFDDVYDSDINIDYLEYEHFRLLEYCRRCNIDVDRKSSNQEIGNEFVRKLWEYYNRNGGVAGFFSEEDDSEVIKLSNDSFIMRFILEYNKSKEFGLAVGKAIQKEYEEFIAKLKAIFRTVCFSTTPYSQLMWGGAYADNHRGFCLEYSILPNEKSYEEIYYNLFPLIYCKIRPEMSCKLMGLQDEKITKEMLWAIYSNGVLRKSMDWAFQNEWRLVLPMKNDKTINYNVKFFPITKVFLGNRMSYDNRKVIIDICHEKNIPYIGVKRKNSLYEMEPCSMKCENCLKYNARREENLIEF